MDGIIEYKVGADYGIWHTAPLGDWGNEKRDACMTPTYARILMWADLLRRAAPQPVSGGTPPTREPAPSEYWELWAPNQQAPAWKALDAGTGASA